MFEEVKSVIIDVLGVSEDEVTPEASLTDDLGADSLDAVEIGNSIEEKTGVAISDEDLPTLKTVQDIVDYVESHK
ncbi:MULTISPECIES: acyl carrier protein [Eubacterium]|jgi:acyl carrier protein|uniref:Acyl carrier protein n=1 Tax=Eubacterium ruminantium TaxID=42322 RepID=A0A1T4K5Q5_9FIRM|nr:MULTISPECIES: acyl carrier protein [Eubacterium]MCR5367220.1 acyl carrier protein [Eubacterium sp.]SCW27557.1 acyl carrier protein [Eubacterium ruminantium]SDM14503.1 acyl carrier protein [Eubacterium ruminantium]SJZ37667.1 acyl carrier protein [Eubacterium ruminantium]